VYRPAHFQLDEDTSLELARARSAGSLVVAGDHGLPASVLVPFVVDVGPPTVLRGHLARPNPLVELLGQGPRPALVSFLVADAYVSPSWYPSKLEHHRVVPTWNYVEVQVRGVVRPVADAPWLRQQVRDLTDLHEPTGPARWSVDDAPAEFTEQMLRGILGVELAVEQVEGKAKLSQNRSEADRDGVLASLESTGRSVELVELMQRLGGRAR
jgi:transcriptional regulator